MNEEDRGGSRQVIEGWLEGHAPASVPYIVAFSIFVPEILALNIALEFWLSEGECWVATVRQGMLNAGTMSTWGIPLTIVLTEGVTRMLARHYISKKQRELEIWYQDQIAKWEDRRRQAEVAGKEFVEPRPEPPPGINGNGHRL